MKEIIMQWETQEDHCSRIENAESVAILKGKKGKKRKNWENQNTIWQQKKRFS